MVERKADKLGPDTETELEPIFAVGQEDGAEPQNGDVELVRITAHSPDMKEQTIAVPRSLVDQLIVDKQGRPFSNDPEFNRAVARKRAVIRLYGDRILGGITSVRHVD